MGDLVLIEHMNNAVKALRNLRHNFAAFYGFLADGIVGNSDEENEIMRHKLMVQLQGSLKELEKTMLALNVPYTVPTLNSIDCLFLDSSPEKLSLYHQSLDCYTWMDKMTSYSSSLHSMCEGNHLKRSSIIGKRKRVLPALYNANVLPVSADVHIQNIKSLFPDMILTIVRPLGAHAVLQVTLGRVMKAVVSLRGLLIESVVVRSYNESHTENNKVDLYRPSKYKLFRKVTDNATAAMLHFFTPGLVDLSIRSFFTWLNSYSTLMTEDCKKCHNFLHNNYPPTWREFRTLQPFHEHCRP